MSFFNKHQIILASKSPRRAQLLNEASIPFVIKTKEVEENYPDDLPTEKVAAYLAQKKAKAAVEFIETNEIILAADSVVILDNLIFGKPKDYEDAYRILSRLSGKMHKVITGVCLLAKEKEETFSAISNVYFNHLSEEEIAYYITHFKPYDKAGAYAIQEWIGLCRINRIEGLYSNIMGLPVELVYEKLKTF